MSSVCHLHTGFQGGGKTLYTLWVVEKLRLATDRRVFYSGINELTLPGWEQFGGPSTNPDRPWDTDPSEWYKLPDGAIIVIDEAQRLFRARALGSKVPEYVSAMETLRHRGLELFLITQDPTLLDSNVRKLCGDHVHLMRKFGMHASTAHRFVGVRDTVAKSRKDSMRSTFRFPKKAFAWYKSAEVHTVKKSPPWTQIGVMAGVVGMLCFLGYRVSLWNKPVEPVAAAAGAARPAGSPVDGISGARAKAPGFDAASYQERVAGLPYTAPRYDELTQPQRVPVVVGCVLIGVPGRTGWCFTQQGTKLYPPVAFIQSYLKNGQFQDFDAGTDVRAPAGQSAGTKTAQSSSNTPF
jgi:zona occludens toxin